jgi:hypothetical protein
MKKLILMVAPVLMLAAFVVMPAMASAATREYGTETGGVFTAFAKNTKVVSKKATGSGNFILEGKMLREKIECGAFSGAGTAKNEGGVGKSTDELRFLACQIRTGPDKGCEVNTPGAGEGELVGIMTDEVNVAGNGVTVSTRSGFEIESAICGEADCSTFALSSDRER